MAQPTFRRQWTKILPDGTAKPQFEGDGTDHQCEDYTGPVAQILFHPISPDLAEKIKSHGDVAEASNLKPLEFDVPPGAEVKFYRTGMLRLDPVSYCGFCGAVYDYEIDECPRCLALNQWYCGKCDSLQKKPILDTILATPEKEQKIIKIVPHLQKWAWKIAENLPGKWGFYSVQARCPECEKTDPRGLKLVECTGKMQSEEIFTFYDLQIGSERHRILDYKLNKPIAK